MIKKGNKVKDKGEEINQEVNKRQQQHQQSPLSAATWRCLHNKKKNTFFKSTATAKQKEDRHSPEIKH